MEMETMGSKEMMELQEHQISIIGEMEKSS